MKWFQPFLKSSPNSRTLMIAEIIAGTDVRKAMLTEPRQPPYCDCPNEESGGDRGYWERMMGFSKIGFEKTM